MLNPSIELEVNLFPVGRSFVSCKIAPRNTKILSHLQDLGCRTIDVGVDLVLERPASLTSYKGMRFASEGDCDAVKTLAEQSFSYDRFHQDPRICNEVASSIKKEWAGNFFSGKRGAWMVVAEQDGCISGFLQLLWDKPTGLVIDLICVEESKRGQGIASSMISFAVKSCLNSVTHIKVGTQISNIESLTFYQRSGFTVTSGFYVLHRHGLGNSG